MRRSTSSSRLSRRGRKPQRAARPGTFNIDTGLSKGWNITESQTLKFTWEMFNATNTPRFDVGTMQLNANNSLSNVTSFGNFSSTLSNPRVMEFALRYSF